jgi:hypothetical protein
MKTKNLPADSWVEFIDEVATRTDWATIIIHTPDGDVRYLAKIKNERGADYEWYKVIKFEQDGPNDQAKNSKQSKQ